MKPPRGGKVWLGRPLPMRRHSRQMERGFILVCKVRWGMKDAPAGNLGPTLLWTCTGGRVSGVSTLRERVLERSKSGRARLLPIDEPSLRSCMMMPPALLTTLLSWMDIINLFRLSHSLCTTISSSPVIICGVRRYKLTNFR